MKQAILKAASIGWEVVYDDQGEATGRSIIVGIDFMPNDPNAKRYGFTRQIRMSESAFEQVFANDVTRLNYVKNTIAQFCKAASRFDCLLSKEDVERLDEALCRGFAKFNENKDSGFPWCHIFNLTHIVQPGEMYQDMRGKMHHADKEPILVVTKAE